MLYPQNCLQLRRFDEIQEVESWEKAVNSFMTDFDVDIYVAGSNSRMLSSEISTYLTGRYVSFLVKTFTVNSPATSGTADFRRFICKSIRRMVLTPS